MGWLVGRKATGWTPKQICVDAFTRTSSLRDDQKPIVLSAVDKGNAVFIAAKFPSAYFEHPDTDDFRHYYQATHDDSVTSAIIYLYDQRNGEFGYKSTGELSGPNKLAPSKAFLDLLTPLSPVQNERTEWARCWRTESLANIQAESDLRRKIAAIKRGDIVHLAEPLRFGDGCERQTFIARHQSKKPHLIYQAQDGAMCRFNSSHLAQALINPTPQQIEELRVATEEKARERDRLEAERLANWEAQAVEAQAAEAQRAQPDAEPEADDAPAP